MIYFQDPFITIHENNNNYNIVHAPTSNLNPEQLEADKFIAFNKRNPYIEKRIEETQRHIKNIKSKNPSATFETSGFSLGGTVAVKSLSNKYINQHVRKVTVENPGTNPIFNYFADIKSPKQINKITVKKVHGDLISSGFIPGKVQFSEPKFRVPTLRKAFPLLSAVAQTFVSHRTSNIMA